ncbi:MAG: very short patch repair endonuclease [Candidatus Dormibacteria bacterium]
MTPRARTPNAHADLQPRRRRRRRRRPLTKHDQMARVKSRDTGLELRLRRALWAAGLRYRIRPKLPGTPDLSFPRARLAIFVDGCFWHGCPDHYRRPATNVAFWAAKLDRNVTADRAADAALGELGWGVIRVWEHDVLTAVDGVVTRVLDALDKPRRAAKVGASRDARVHCPR